MGEQAKRLPRSVFAPRYPTKQGVVRVELTQTIDDDYATGEGNSIAQFDATITVTNSTFKNWRRGIGDNESGKREAKSVVIVGNSFYNAPIHISAYESITVEGNTLAAIEALDAFEKSYINIISCTNAANAKITVIGNTLDASTAAYSNVGNANSVFSASNVNVQEGIFVKAQ